MSTALADPHSTVDGSGPSNMVGDAKRLTVNQAVEYAQNDWRLKGKAKVIRQRVTGRTTKPATLDLEVCIDNAGVRVVDKSGKPVSLDQGAPTRSLNLITLHRKAKAWVVADVSFPDDPDC